MESFINNTLTVALWIHVGLVAVALGRIWRGENAVDRLTGVDLLSTLTLSILVLVALVTRESIYLDVALALAALGFVGVIALARYLVDEQVF
jgi:multisubunit Na+/H+ antiporter MnhF subunit